MPGIEALTSDERKGRGSSTGLVEGNHPKSGGCDSRDGAQWRWRSKRRKIKEMRKNRYCRIGRQLELDHVTLPLRTPEMLKRVSPNPSARFDPIGPLSGCPITDKPQYLSLPRGEADSPDGRAVWLRMFQRQVRNLFKIGIEACHSVTSQPRLCREAGIDVVD